MLLEPTWTLSLLIDHVPRCVYEKRGYHGDGASVVVVPVVNVKLLPVVMKAAWINCEDKNISEKSLFIHHCPTWDILSSRLHSDKWGQVMNLKGWFGFFEVGCLRYLFTVSVLPTADDSQGVLVWKSRKLSLHGICPCTLYLKYLHLFTFPSEKHF